uniref:Na_Ca_ex domain-containing protein n=1 Tax=Haemonchus placei TaxID=6290 RepID=A0A0N4X205_HAEPC
LTTSVETCSIAVAATFIFGWSVSISIICGLVLAAISPAVTVPVMLDLQNRGLGSRKGIPTIVLASATLDNILCITAFSIVTTIAFSTGKVGKIVHILILLCIIR